MITHLSQTNAFDFRKSSRAALVASRHRRVDLTYGTQIFHEERNGAGTFGFLVTLKKYERCEKCPEGLRGLSWRTDYD